MRKISLFLAILMILTVVFSVSVSADPDKKAIVSYGTAIIDGEIDEIWNSVEGYKTTNIYRDGERLTDTVSEWKMMWDENRMYVIAIVTDSELNSQNETFWQNDCTQLFISFNIWENFEDEEYDGTTNSLGIRYAVEGVLTHPDTFLVQLMGSGEYLDQDDPLYLDIERAWKITPTGYVMEYSFDPRKYCDTFKLEAGQKGGVDFINDDSMAGSDKRDVLYHWSVEGDTWGRPEHLSLYELAPKPEPPPEPDPVVDETAAGGGEAADIEIAVAPVVAAPAAPVAPAPKTSDTFSIFAVILLISAGIVLINSQKRQKNTSK